MYNFIFDVDDTLYDQLEPFKQAFQENFSLNKKISVELLYRYSRKFSDEVFELSQQGSISMNEMYIYRLTKAFNEFDISIQPQQALDFQKDYAAFQEKITLLPDIEKTLDYCTEKQLTVGIITNGPSQHQRNKIKNLNLTHWINPKNIFVSGELEMAKPDKRIFYYVENQMKLETQKTFYIGDSYRNDVLGAKSAGWKTIWYNRRGHLIKNKVSEPDFIVGKEEEIYDLVRSLVS
ncbi:HAD family hydrolase [Enterococcus ureasiticus]|uniref:Hydrolase n=1 Tax=Enterococcus ureasiticus TaxID=903984 RepID=A0A1E5GA89_9ENTE|nr:HAD family hydrolase [Enterococcus ureasiticus]OEG09577.1 hydrolase [Enterococcus ureasiticus]